MDNGLRRWLVAGAALSACSKPATECRARTPSWARVGVLRAGARCAGMGAGNKIRWRGGGVEMNTTQVPCKSRTCDASSTPPTGPTWRTAPGGVEPTLAHPHELPLAETSSRTVGLIGTHTMTPRHAAASPCAGTRREFLWESGAGFAGLALTALLEQDGFFARHASAAEARPGKYADPLAPKNPHFKPK